MNLSLVSIVAAAGLLCLATFPVEAQNGWKTHTVEGEFSFKYPTSWDLKERENRFTSRDANHSAIVSMYVSDISIKLQ